jgi:hypothetical protein
MGWSRLHKLGFLYFFDAFKRLSLAGQAGLAALAALASARSVKMKVLNINCTFWQWSALL